jgi:hypothetical protein
MQAGASGQKKGRPLIIALASCKKFVKEDILAVSGRQAAASHLLVRRRQLEAKPLLFVSRSLTSEGREFTIRGGFS